MRSFQWDGEKLSEVDNTLPILSSGVEFALTSKIRKAGFTQIVSAENPTREQFLTYHNSVDENQQFSVKMSRPEAQTVSLSHIVVAKEIEFNYVDYICHRRTFCKETRSQL